jgi:hypothetical protein
MEGPNLASARRALVLCQERFIQVLHDFYDKLYTVNWVNGLNELVRERTHEWTPWSKGVLSALSAYPHALYDIELALSACWQSLTEGMSSPPVWVQTTSVGQEIHIGRDKESLEPQAP